MAEGGGGSRHGMSIFGVIVLVMLVLYGLQIYLNPPYKRPITACWLPYQIERMVLVEAPKIFMPRDADMAVDNAFKVARWNRSCVCALSKQKWLTQGQASNVPFSCGN